MKRYAAMARNPKGDLVNIAFDNRTFQHKHSAKHFAEQMSLVVIPEIEIVEVDEITDTERLDWMIEKLGRIYWYPLEPNTEPSAQVRCLGGKDSGYFSTAREAIEGVHMIYRDFDHYWREGDHPWSSCSYDIAQEEYKRFEHTINASRDEYKQMYVELSTKVAKNKSELVDALFQYMELHKKEDAPSFFRWWSNQIKEESK